MKRIEQDGRYYRMRRGRLVEIPPGWVGRGVRKEQIRSRKTSKKAARKKPNAAWGPTVKKQTGSGRPYPPRRVMLDYLVLAKTSLRDGG